MMALSNLATETPVPHTWTPTFLFSASVNLGKTVGPIPLVEGGIRYVEPITGGTISGPGFNATIEGGLAAPVHIPSENAKTGQSFAFAYVYAYGHASDGSPFYMEESGPGITAVQNTRIHMMVGGQYQDIQKAYILAQPSLSADKTMATVNCYSIPLPS